MKPLLHNIHDKVTLKEKIGQENFTRVTISFYRYVAINDPIALRDQLYAEWNRLGVLGRIYLAKEGINAQFSVPKPNLEIFKASLQKHQAFEKMPFKWALKNDESFLKLKIQVKDKIVADGLNDSSFDASDVGQHLTAKEFNAAIDQGAIVVDMRNHYESEIGHFDKAITPQVETFKEELPKVKQILADKKGDKILLYCTGGIRCEKASAYLKHHGFKDVNQLHGGIIDYAKQVKEQGLENKFKGKNFVFDDRLSEPISDDVIAHCHQCGAKADQHTNCANVACNLLFIQCDACKSKFENCCTPSCKQINSLPEDIQKNLRKGKKEKKRFNKGVSDPMHLRSLIQKQLLQSVDVDSKRA